MAIGCHMVNLLRQNSADHVKHRSRDIFTLYCVKGFALGLGVTRTYNWAAMHWRGTACIIMQPALF